ncbi:uncharacterized protein [Lepeophtheirus salmonis]|uniref:uncharacterized protein n=1 Tax=Lepeophtheirus salmonis TaxID=72036 RepID=UPI003AF342C1
MDANESPRLFGSSSTPFSPRGKQEENGKEEIVVETWDFMRDELEDFEKALQSFVSENETTPPLIIVEKELTPKTKKKKPPLMPKPTLHKLGAIRKTLVSSGFNGSNSATPKPYMETDI